MFETHTRGAPPAQAQSTAVAAALLVVMVFGHLVAERVTLSDSLTAWSTMFMAIVVQSVPFLLAGVLISAMIARFLSERLLRRVMPRNPVLAVPVAGIAGFGLPGCECAAVPVSDGLIRRGLPASAALTFLLAAPAINPAVIISTAVAFPASHLMVVARITASLITAVVVGWICLARGDRMGMVGLDRVHAHDHGFAAGVLHDFLHAGGFLVLGAMAAAAVNTFVPRDWVTSVAGSLALSVLVLAGFAFVAALCSESDAFVAASLTAFSPIAQLTFLVVGPAMDIKLAAMESGQFGARFARQFVPLVLAVAISVAVLIGWALL